MKPNRCISALASLNLVASSMLSTCSIAGLLAIDFIIIFLLLFVDYLFNLSKEDILKELIDGKGKQFDPELLDLFLPYAKKILNYK